MINVNVNDELRKGLIQNSKVTWPFPNPNSQTFSFFFHQSNCPHLSGTGRICFGPFPGIPGPLHLLTTDSSEKPVITESTLTKVEPAIRPTAAAEGIHPCIPSPHLQQGQLRGKVLCRWLIYSTLQCIWFRLCNTPLQHIMQLNVCSSEAGCVSSNHKIQLNMLKKINMEQIRNYLKPNTCCILW